MRQWTLDSSPARTSPGQALAGLIGRLGEKRFESSLLEQLQPLVPAASCSIYRTGRNCAPRLFMSASYGVRDTTRDCWQAYLSGPYISDRTLVRDAADSHQALLCHITASEVPVEHRARVYEAHGVAERLSVVQQAAGALFAVNFYRHEHQRPFNDAALGHFESMAPALLSLTQKHIALADSMEEAGSALLYWRQQLHRRYTALTPRELDVCARLLLGMTQEGIACDLQLSMPTVKTYRNRAFARLGIHFRNQLFALLHTPASAGPEDGVG
ncbi:helix-turn-helix transcriptional regulator [Polaromonas sp. SM01]|uniref:helix-turn-helix transcriptional regulator n=1 Tax=Polaromonas sp. SM01 TaxID=3085630 RepID=UPI00298145B0|nr:helix-turn-helix transcriptional regulator [Polaromonas sp. SM01]MDW5443252.1 helix-turn-helix transcriptional regulator [Polaromonas sp. SM01]